MKRVALSLAIVVAGACADDPPIEPKTCDVACGVGFTCEEARCVLDAGAAVEVELLAPVDRAWFNDAEVAFECRVKAPQVSRVTVRVTGEGSDPTEIELEKMAAQDSWQGASTLADGEFEANCVIEFGPQGATASRESEPATFGVASSAPVVTLEPVEGWFGASAEVTVRATQVGGTPAETASLTVDSPPLRVEGVADGEGGWTFNVKASSLTKEAIEKEFAFDVTIKDKAGSTGTAEGVIKVDTIDPSVAITSEGTWVQAGGTAEVEVTATDGVGVAAVRLTVAEKSYMGVLQGSLWKFNLDIGLLAPSGYEGEMPYVVVVSDFAGNNASATGTLLVDTISPKVVSASIAEWFGAGATALVTATVVEGYGVESASLTFAGSSLVVQGESQDGELWAFPVEVDLLAGGPMEAVKDYEIVVEDASGNVGKAVGALRVDNVVPVVTRTFESTWLQADGTARVAVDVVEGGLVEAVTLTIRGRTYQGTRADALWEFSVPVVDVLQPGDETLVPYVVTVRDAAGNQAAIDGTIGLDSVAPTIVIKPLPEWVRRDSTMTVEAIVSDGATVDPASLLLAMGDQRISGVQGENGACIFEVPLESATTQDVEGAVPFTISAADLAGNVSTKGGTIKVDGSAPRVTVTGNPDATWRGAGTFDFTAAVSATGAPVVTATLSRSVGSLSLTSITALPNLKFVVDTATWQMDGTEGTVPWTLRVVDAAGHQIVQTGEFRIDRKSPSISLGSPSNWFNTQTVEVSPTVSDGGSGPSTTYLEWEASGERGACSRASGTWKCPVVTLLAEGKVNASFPYRVYAKDLVGNTASSDGTLKIDKKPPTLAVVADGKWYPRTATIQVTANVSDADAGFGTSPPVLTISSPLASTHEGTLNQGVATFSIPASAVVNAGGTAQDVKVKVQVMDLLGNVGEVESPAQFSVDNTAPLLSTLVAYPSGRTNVVIRDPFGSGARSKAQIVVTTADGGSGLDFVKLTRGGVEQPLVSTNGDKYTFRVDAADVTDYGGAGSFSVAVTTRDLIGNTRQATVAVEYSRHLWSRRAATYEPVSGLALGGDRLFVPYKVSGATASNLYALNRNDGSTSWSSHVDGTPTTAVTVGTQYSVLYAAVGSDAAAGTVSVYPANQSNNATASAKFTGAGQSRGGLAFAWLPWEIPNSSTVSMMTFFAAGTDDYLRAFPLTCLGTYCEKEEPVAAYLAASSYWTAPAVVGESIYAGSSDGRVGRGRRYRHDHGGGIFSTAMSGTVTPVEAQSVPIHGLAMGALASTWHVMSNGVRWILDLGHPEFHSSPHTGSATSMVWGNGYRYFGASPGGVYYHGSASTVSRAALFSTVMKTPPVVGQRKGGAEEIYVVEGGTFRALNVPATSKWSMPMGSTLETAPVLDCHGVIYFAARDGTVHALVTDSAGLSDATWPRYQHDNRNTGDYNYNIWNGTTCVD